MSHSVWDQYKIKENQWKCSTCSLVNEEINEKCKSCETLRPVESIKRKREEDVEVSDTKKVHENDNSNASKIFSFGVSAATSGANLFNFGANTETDLSKNKTASNLFNEKTKIEASNVKKVINTKQGEVINTSIVKPKNGLMYIFGNGECGQLGLGDEIYEAPTPIAMNLRKKIIQIACGGMHCIAITSSGSVISWGCNDDGALVSAGDNHSLALTSTGILYGWGTYRDENGRKKWSKQEVQKFPVKLSAPIGIIKIKSGGDYSMAIGEDNVLYSWGCGDQGQLGRKATKDVLKIKKVNLKVKVEDVFCGTYHAFAVERRTKKVFGWGQNGKGQLGTGDCENQIVPLKINEFSNKKIVRMSCGMHHTIAISESGKIYCVGSSNSGQLGINSTTEIESNVQEIPSLSDTPIKYISCGKFHSLCLSQDNRIFTWGFGDTFQLGTGDDKDVLVPKEVVILSGSKIQIEGGTQHSLLLVEK